MANLTRSTFLVTLETVCAKYLTTGQVDCPICLDSLTNGGIDNAPSEKPVLLHGQHVVGDQCILTWLDSHNTCPCCRQILFQAEKPTDQTSLEDDASDDEGVATIRQFPLHSVNGDVWRLRELRGTLREFYRVALEEQDRDSIRFYSASIMARLIQRTSLFRQNLLVGSNIFFHPWRRLLSPVDQNDDTTERLDAKSAMMALWAWWWSHFTAWNRPGHYTTLHHPMATAALFETIRAIRRWNGWCMGPVSAANSLRIRLQHFCTQQYLQSDDRIEFPASWDDYQEDLIMAASNAIADSNRLCHFDELWYRHGDHEWLYVLAGM